ncbi:MAG: hypothetical protein WKF94_06200 [Solirubrobacteraceae bacterium]
MTSVADEETKTGGEGFADAVTVSFGDLERGWFGLARLGRSSEGTSALAVLFRGQETVGAYAVGRTSDGDSPLTMTVDAPLERWTVDWNGTDCGFEVVVSALAAPVERAGGFEGYEQFVRVEGSVRVGEEMEELSAVGQRGHTWGVADWSSLSLVRSVSAWLGNGGFVLESERPARADGHDREEVWAALVENGEPAAVMKPRLSTTYDGDGHQRRAGLELWMTDEEEGFPVRAAGEVICGSSLDLGALQLDLAFFHWRAQGVEGVGRYDILRRSSDT